MVYKPGSHLMLPFFQQYVTCFCYICFFRLWQQQTIKLFCHTLCWQLISQCLLGHTEDTDSSTRGSVYVHGPCGSIYSCISLQRVYLRFSVCPVIPTCRPFSSFIIRKNTSLLMQLCLILMAKITETVFCSRRHTHTPGL